MSQDGPKKLTAVHGPLGLTYHLIEKTNAIADCFENLFTPQDLCDKNHKQHIEN
jgi:hypothetical protein